MDSLTRSNFGLLIAYMIPGAIGLYGLSYWVPRLGYLLKIPPSGGAFLYIVFLSVGVSLLLSPIRYWLFDRLILEKICGIDNGKINYSKLRGNLNEYQAIIDNHYKYYKFFSHSFIFVLFAYISMEIHSDTFSWPLLFIVITFLFLLGISSYQSMKNFNDKATKLLPQGD